MEKEYSIKLGIATIDPKKEFHHATRNHVTTKKHVIKKNHVVNQNAAFV